MPGSAVKPVKDSETDLDDLETKTEDMKLKISFSSPKLSTQTGSVKKTLKEVVIPSSNFKSSAQRSKGVISSQSPSPSDSELSSVHDQSSEYETAATSAAVTPAESLSTLSRSAGSKKTTDNTNKQSKRKREELDGDALLAQMLQEEEYQNIKPEDSLIKRRQRVLMEDSEDELEHTDSMDIESPNVGLLPNKRIRPNNRTLLPTRAARDSARKSINEEISREIMGTDSDESELSEYMSDEDLEDLEESDVLEDEGLEGTTTTDLNAASSTATPAARRSRVVNRVTRRNASTTNTNRSHRGGWQRRMTSRVRFFTCLSLRKKANAPLGGY